MRKWIALFLCMLQLLMILPAYAVTASQLYGEWYLNHASMMGVQLSPASLGLSLTLTLNENGTARMQGTLPNLESEAVWQLDDTTLTVGSMTFSCRDGQLTAQMEEGGMSLSLVLTRDAVETALTQPAQVLASAALEDFTGCWQAESVLLENKTIPYAALGDPMVLLIEEDVTMLSGKDASTLPLLAVRDGQLMFGAEKAAILTLSMMEDGTLHLPSGQGSIVFTRQGQE